MRESATPVTWRSLLERAYGDGLTCLELLVALDWGQEREVIVRVLDPDTAATRELSVRVPADHPRLDSATAVYPGAGWWERQAAESFGLQFTGHPDLRPLLRRSSAGRPPMLKDVVLVARATTTWPGASEPGGSPGRRRLLPPGVPAQWGSS